MLTVPELAEIGVKRVSLGSALSRAALGAFLRAAREIKERGSFTFAGDAVPFAELNAKFAGWTIPQGDRDKPGRSPGRQESSM